MEHVLWSPVWNFFSVVLCQQSLLLVIDVPFRFTTNHKKKEKKRKKKSSK